GAYVVLAAEEGNGWIGSDDPDEIIYLPRRTKIIIRVHSDQKDEVKQLSGQVLRLKEHEIEIGDSSERLFSTLTTIYARHVVSDCEDESEFLVETGHALKAMNVRAKKLLCGKLRCIRTPQGELKTRSLMLADLDIEDAIKLQQDGLGAYRELGCGVFVPHKSIKKVGGDEAA
ncbi:MAG: type I-MYXAN CRISPR-associated protein Cas6/Cmx6, partial [Gammaproteobacteria bacterium]|nr:type I-MYXAN CRISPR-associated protein Cas6/Cmx6 [Gammaproteobacteria bacterium]